MSIKSTAEVVITDVESELSRLETLYQNRKSQLVSVVQSHIADHQKQAAAHATEIAAAQSILDKALPATTTPEAKQAAVLLLTAPSGVQKAVVWVAKQWRYLTMGGAVTLIGYGIHAGLVHL